MADRALREYASRSHETEMLKLAGPNLFERVVRLALQVVAIITLCLTSVLLVIVLLTMARIGDALGRLNNPTPAVTGCPFGDQECGG